MPRTVWDEIVQHENGADLRQLDCVDSAAKKWDDFVLSFLVARIRKEMNSSDVRKLGKWK